MAKAKEPLSKSTPKITLVRQIYTPKTPEHSLFMIRLKELDREFMKQSRHLAKVTRDVRRKIIEKM